MCVSGNRSENFRLGRHTYHFLILFFLEKKIILCILKGILPFKLLKIIFLSENLKKSLGFTGKFRQGGVTLNTGIVFLFGPTYHSISFFFSRLIPAGRM